MESCGATDSFNECRCVQCPRASPLMPSRNTVRLEPCRATRREATCTPTSRAAPPSHLGGADVFGRPSRRGTRSFMIDDRTGQRATLLPEEQEMGSAAPRAQAEAILADSDRREDEP